MTPQVAATLSKAEAAARAAFIVFAGAFVGALVLPLSSTGSLPATWEAWKPVLGTALGAAVGAELWYVRTHISAIAGQLGLIPSSSPPTNVGAVVTVGTSDKSTKSAGFIAGDLMMPIGFMALGIVVVLAYLCSGCAAVPAIVNSIPDDVQTGMCAYGVIKADTALTPPASWEQMALDLGNRCGMDVAAIIKDFGEKHPISVAALARANEVNAAASMHRAGAGAAK